MYKIVIIFSLFTTLIFSATSQQVDEYMSITHSDRELIEIEKMFSNLSDTMNLEDDNISQQITISYQTYLGKHISENEMNKLLALYRKPIMQQYINETDMFDIPAEEMEIFLAALKENPLSTERQDLINELVATIINEDLLLKFYNSMMQRYQGKKKNQDKNEKSKKALTTEEKQFIKLMKKGITDELLYGTQVLNLDEIKKINKLMKSSVITKVINIEHEAIIQIMENFIKNIIAESNNLEKK